MAKTKRGIASEFGKAYKALRQCYPNEELDQYGFKIFIARRLNGNGFYVFRFRWDEHYDTSWCDYYISTDGLETVDYMGTFCVGARQLYASSVYERMGLTTEEEWCDVQRVYQDERDLLDTVEDFVYSHRKPSDDGTDWNIRLTNLGRESWYVHRFLMD